MISSRRGLLLIGALTLLVGLVVLFPARVAYHWAAPEGVEASGIQGSIWRGSADAVGASGVYLRDVRWSARPWHVLTGRMVYRVEANPVAGFLEGDLFVAMGRSVSIIGNDVRSSLPLDLFESSLGIRGLQGNASLQLEHVELRDGVPVRLDGVIEVADLVIAPLNRGTIGGYRAEFFTTDDGISGSIEDTDGLVDIAGSLTLRSDRSYQFIAKVMAKPNTPTAVRNQMRLLPPANERGQQELRIEGSL